MTIKKEREIIKKAAELVMASPGNHACRNSSEGICPVVSTISDDLIFVNNKSHLRCPHYMPFGYGGFCNLPARKEAYKLYGV